MPTSDKCSFIKVHGLPDKYLQEASIWFDPLIESLSTHQNEPKTPLIIGINGCQGSGKTTFADYLSMSFNARGLKSIAISIDDFYLTYQERQDLAADIHPLLATRGVPGTHDIPLALATLKQLTTQDSAISIPRFDKGRDERFPQSKWPVVKAPMDIVILEGWCVGVGAQTEHNLNPSVNALESSQDPDGVWRRFVNQKLETAYPALWSQIDCMLMLQAPSFDCVYQWRLEQEQKLSESARLAGQKTPHKIMSPDQIKRFIQHYERLSRHCLESLPGECQHVFKLGQQRQIIGYRSPKEMRSKSPPPSQGASCFDHKNKGESL